MGQRQLTSLIVKDFFYRGGRKPVLACRQDYSANIMRMLLCRHVVEI